MDELVTLDFEFPGGAGVLEVGLDHPLAGPYRLALEDGRPFDAWRWVVFGDSGHRQAIGCFVLTAGDRFLFFPATLPLFAPFGGDNGSGGRIGHVTLDPPRRRGRHRSHVAGPSRLATRGGRYSGGHPPDYLAPWLSLVVPDLVVFPILPERLVVRAPRRRPDIEAWFRSFGDGGLAVVPAPQAAGSPNFVQVDVWAGYESGWETKKVRLMPWAYKIPEVHDVPEEQQRVPVTRINLSFGADRGIVVVIAQPAGRLDEAHLLRANLAS